MNPKIDVDSWTWNARPRIPVEMTHFDRTFETRLAPCFYMNIPVESPKCYEYRMSNFRNLSLFCPPSPFFIVDVRLVTIKESQNRSTIEGCIIVTVILGQGCFKWTTFLSGKINKTRCVCSFRGEGRGNIYQTYNWNTLNLPTWKIV